MLAKVSFINLPTNLRRKYLKGLKPAELKTVIVAAGREAGLKFNVTPKSVFDSNRGIFGNAMKVITEAGAEKLRQLYGAKTTDGLKKALKKAYEVSKPSIQGENPIRIVA